MAGEIIASLGAFKAMLDLAKGLKDISDSTTRNAVAIELQEKILSAQEQQTALAERIRKLEAQVTGFETWKTEKQRYQLTDFGGGTFAYLLKPDMGESEPAHRICASCYEKGRRSTLQFDGRNAFQQERYTCPACKTKFNFGERADPPTKQNRGPRGNWGRR